MYPEVKAEMARKGITLAIMSADPRLDCTIGTLSQKINGKSPLTWPEAIAIKEILKSELPLETLYKEVDE